MADGVVTICQQWSQTNIWIRMNAKNIRRKCRQWELQQEGVPSQTAKTPAGTFMTWERLWHMTSEDKKSIDFVVRDTAQGQRAAAGRPRLTCGMWPSPNRAGKLSHRFRVINEWRRQCVRPQLHYDLLGNKSYAVQHRDIPVRCGCVACGRCWWACWQVVVHRSSSVVTLALPPTRSLPGVLFATRHLTSGLYGIDFLNHLVSHVLIYLFLIHLFSTVISPHECHHHHSCHPSPHLSSLSTSKLFFFFLNPTLHRHLAPLQTAFMDTRTASRFFLRFIFFLVSYRYFLLF